MILGWYHWPCNIVITKYQFYMAARIDNIVISKLAATAAAQAVAAQRHTALAVGQCQWQRWGNVSGIGRAAASAERWRHLQCSGSSAAAAAQAVAAQQR